MNTKKKIMRLFCSLLALIITHALSAQILVPWLGQNGLYGLAAEDGQVVIAPEFKYPVLFSEKTYFVQATKGDQSGNCDDPQPDHHSRQRGIDPAALPQPRKTDHTRQIAGHHSAARQRRHRPIA